MTREFDLTEREQKAVGSKMLAAAFSSLGSYDRYEDEIDVDEIARLVVRAMASAASVLEDERKRLCLIHSCRSLVIYAEPHVCVASAFAAWMLGHKDLDGISSSSGFGFALLGLAQGLSAARAMSVALDMLQDGSEFAFTSHGAAALGRFFESEGVDTGFKI